MLRYSAYKDFGGLKPKTNCFLVGCFNKVSQSCKREKKNALENSGSFLSSNSGDFTRVLIKSLRHPPNSLNLALSDSFFPNLWKNIWDWQCSTVSSTSLVNTSISYWSADLHTGLCFLSQSLWMSLRSQQSTNQVSEALPPVLESSKEFSLPQLQLLWLLRTK